MNVFFDIKREPFSKNAITRNKEKIKKLKTKNKINYIKAAILYVFTLFQIYFLGIFLLADAYYLAFLSGLIIFLYCSYARLLSLVDYTKGYPELDDFNYLSTEEINEIMSLRNHKKVKNYIKRVSSKRKFLIGDLKLIKKIIKEE